MVQTVVLGGVVSRKKPRLTPWESILLDAVAAGLSLEQIAKRHKKNGKRVQWAEVAQDLTILRQKMGAKNNGHMLEIAVGWGWL